MAGRFARMVGGPAAAVLALAPACRHVAAPSTRPPAPAAAAVDAAGGAVSVRYLVAGGATPSTLPPGQRLIAPYPMARPLPEYPAQALATPGASPAVVAVRILIGIDGRVAAVSDSPLAASSVGPAAALLRAAVEAALSGWAFYPAHVDTFEERDGDGDGAVDESVLVEYRPVEVYYDLAFEFSVVDGTGNVRLALPPS